MAHKAAGEAKDVAGTAREQGRQLTDQAKTELGHVTEDARAQLRDQVSEQTQKATDSLRRLGDQVSALAHGQPQDAGPLAEYAESAADHIRNTAGRMETNGFDGLLEDTKHFARKRPAAFLCAAAIAGFSIGRLLRGGKEARKQHQSPDGHGPSGHGPSGPVASGQAPSTGRLPEPQPETRLPGGYLPPERGDLGR